MTQPHFSTSLDNEIEISLGGLKGRLLVVIEGAGRDCDRAPLLPIAREINLERRVSTSPSGDQTQLALSAINLYEVLAHNFCPVAPSAIALGHLPSRTPELTHWQAEVVERLEQFDVCVQNLLSSPGPRASQSCERPAEDQAHDADEDSYQIWHCDRPRSSP
jgi:hypothetical protein